MFSRMMPNKFNHKCPVYQGFSLIDVKPNEAFVEPVRAANRLRKGLAMLIYAQQWFAETIGEGTVDIYTTDIAQRVTRILEILGDSNAIWNAKGEKMRPVHVLLDLFGAVYLRLNDLQNDIKSLAGQPLRMAQDKSTRQTIKKDVLGIKLSLQEILVVMEAMPRYKATISPNTSSMRDRRFPKIDFSDESEADEEMTDAKFGILLANASSEELNELRRQAERVRVRSRRRSHVYSVLTEASDVYDAVADDDVLPELPTSDVSRAPPQIDLSAAAMSRFSAAARVNSLYQSYRDVPTIEHDKGSSTLTRPGKILPVLSEDGETLEFPSCPAKFFLTRQRPIEIMTERQRTPQTMEEGPSSTDHVELSDLPYLEDVCSNPETSLSSGASKIRPRQPDASTTSCVRESWDMVAEKGLSSQVADESDSAIDQYYAESDSSSEIGSDYEVDGRVSHAIYATATKVLMSRDVVQERSYCKPVMLQKSKRSTIGPIVNSRAYDSRIRSFIQEDFVNDYRTSFDCNDQDSSVRSSIPDSGIYTLSDSASSTQASPVARSEKFSDMLVMPELIALPSDVDDEDDDSSWVMDATGLLCLDKSKIYTLANLAELQQHFGARLEQVVIKASKDEISSRFRLSTEIGFDGVVWRVRS